MEHWDDLRHFLAVARHGSLAAASRDLGVNQSTVFRRIGQLETSLSARLFDRQARGYALTAIGEEMLQLASKVEDDILAVYRTVASADLEPRGTVHITTLDEVLERIAPDLQQFRERYPGIHLNVNTELRIFSLSRREADVAIRPGDAPTEPDIIGRKLVGLRMAAYVSPDYLKGRKPPRRMSELSGHHLIGFGESRRDAQTFGKIPDDAPIVYRANSMNGQAIAARAGIGVAMLPTFVGDPDPHLRRLFLKQPAAETAESHLWILIHADLRQTARVRAFVDFITEAVRAQRSLYEANR